MTSLMAQPRRESPTRQTSDTRTWRAYALPAARRQKTLSPPRLAITLYQGELPSDAVDEGHPMWGQAAGEGDRREACARISRM